MNLPPNLPANQGKFIDPQYTAKGEPRAHVDFQGLKTLWFNTGTLCNISCVNCYIESSPTNDRLVYLNLEDITPFLSDIKRLDYGQIEVGFTGGEPFLNPDIIALMEAALEAGHKALVLTNAMRPMMRPRVQDGLKALQTRFANKITMRISLDHWCEAQNDAIRGRGSFKATLEGINWLQTQGFKLALAGRAIWGESDVTARRGYGALITSQGWHIDTNDLSQMVIFPEMDVAVEVPEITTNCWKILGKRPKDQMCASQRMVVKRKGEEKAVIIPCTLLPYDAAFEMGDNLEAASASVSLNHPHCAKFCVLGGGSCSV